MTLSGSRLGLADTCPPSVCLPQANEENHYGTRGRGIHRFMEEANKHGREEALAGVSEDIRELCEAIDLESLPLDLEPELALAYDVASEATRILGIGINRDYGELYPFEVPMTLDLGGLRGNVAVCCDYKSGYKVDRARDSLQAKTGALALARLHGVDDAEARIIRVYDDGETWEDSYRLDAFELADVADKVRRIFQRTSEAKSSIERGETPRVTEGAHCRRCNAMPYCHAKRGLIQTMVDGEIELEFLDEHTAAEAYRRLKAAEAFLGKVKSALRDFAEKRPVPLGSGRWYGKQEKWGDRSLDADVVYEVIRKKHGQAIADAAVSRKASQASIERALKGNVPKIAPAKREIMEALEERGAVRRPRVTKVAEYTLELEEGEEGAA